MKFILYTALIGIFLAFISTCAMTALLYRMQYSKRVEANCSGKNQSEFQTKTVSFCSGKNKLAGSFYWQNGIKNLQQVVIIVHGYGLTHLDYQLEIEHFVKKGNVVFAYDLTGCGASEGKNPKGFGQFILDTKVAVNYVRKAEPEKKIILFGHSTGAYGVAAYLQEADPLVEKAICVSGFYDCGFYARECMKGKIGILAYLLPFWVHLFEWIKFGSNGAKSGIQGVEQFGKSVLILQGEQDTVVPITASLYGWKEKYTNQKVTCVLIEKADHFPMRWEQGREIV
ncbi:alpha/beta hydrolase [[Clostridium] polysaccharolyticum]|uniref:Serine aminopeptidase, S33 n=1 Tax=[Clostridium] polysaccharolyticum TaxID=29364 RepID=A0A1I0EDG8_9FIRM|nr:alpha/beta fold hydrolase [[Clostridium] polysaccharolyticum]SET43089.1 Serine aminopeptidase, S33 [[Clostridium] polysaccharolyticum]